MNRRGFLQAILAAGVAPAFVKSPMGLFVPKEEIYTIGEDLPLEAEDVLYAGNSLLPSDLIVQEALRILNETMDFRIMLPGDKLNYEYAPKEPNKQIKIGKTGSDSLPRMPSPEQIILK